MSLRVIECVDCEDMLQICKNYSRIFCYGAGHWGRIILHFLNKNGVYIESFIVSQKNKLDSYCGVSIAELESLDSRYLVNSLVILSLTEANHAVLKQAISLKCSTVVLLAVNYKIIRSIPQDVHNVKMIESIKAENCLVDDVEKYKAKAKIILSKYKRVVFRYLYISKIGYISLGWIFYMNINHPSDEYWLFYPGPSSKKANKFLVDKILNREFENIDFVKENNLAFWKYFLGNYPGFVEVDGSGASRKFHTQLNKVIPFVDKNKKRVLVHFTDGDIIRGNHFLEQHALDKYVCIFARDGRYSQEFEGYVDENRTSDDYYRALSIDAFSLSAKFLLESNIVSVRMGSMPEGDAPDFIFDYGRKYHSDFLDVFLFSRCRYFIGTPSGVQHLADLFSKPIVIVNSPVLSTENSCSFVGKDGNLMIIQKYWDSVNSRYLTIRDMLTIECYGQAEYNPNAPRRTMGIYHQRKILPVKNTPEEIFEVTQEMEEILAGTVVYDDLDLELQSKYDKIVSEFVDAPNFIFPYRLGRDFLKKNQWLLE